MKRIFAYTETVTADASGDATVYFGKKIHGCVHAIKYVPGTIDTGGDLVFTGEDSGVAILTKSNAGTSTVWFYPRAIPNKVADGAAFTDVGEPVLVLSERIKLVLAQGGNLGSGTVTIYTEEDQ